MATKLACYPANHPVAVALFGIAYALRHSADLLSALAEYAESVGVRAYSDEFDEAAELAGLQYCRALDLYVDRETKRKADALHFSCAHLAFAA